MSEKDRIQDIKDKFNESYGTLTPLFTKIKESHYMYCNQQWTAEDARRQRKKNIPPLVFNMMKKNADVLVGIHRLSKSAFKVLPEETGDNITASICNIILHFAMRKGGGYNTANNVFKEDVIGGLSWFAPYMDFSLDPINGEFRSICVPYSDIFFDPHMKEIPTLDDCNYIVQRKAIAKITGATMFPDFANEILKSKTEYKSDYFVMEENGLKDKCVVKELWERVLVPCYTISAQGQIFTITAEQYKQLGAEIATLKTLPDYAEMKHSKKVIRLAIMINEDFIVYDGKSIYDGDFYPFVPAVGFYNKSLDQWSLKVSGLLEALKDPQREYNKIKANINHYMLSSIHSGWIMDKNAVDDWRILTKGMSVPVIETNPGKRLERVQPPQMPDMFYRQKDDQLSDFMRIGLNAETLGFNTGDQSAKAIKMKNMQGMASVGELPDNFNSAFIQFGKISMSMILQYYTLNKIKRILGSAYDWVTQEHIVKVRDMAYDLEVDDTKYSPVQKEYRLERKLEMAQYKIEGFEYEDFYDDLDLDAEERMRLDERKQQKQQMQQQMMQQQQATQQIAMASKANADRAKAQFTDVQSQLMGTNVMKNLKELGVNPGSITQEVADAESTGTGIVP